MKAGEQVGKPIAAVVGFAAGKYALKKMDKSQSISGLMGTELKNFLVPAAVTMGGLVATQFTKNEYLKIGLVGIAGAGIESAIKKSTGKTILQGLEGLMGEEGYDTELSDMADITKALPAADIDIEREIERSVSGADDDYPDPEEPVGTPSDYSMSDDPVGDPSDYSMSDDPVGTIQNVDPDPMDFDIFSGDMMAT